MRIAIVCEEGTIPRWLYVGLEQLLAVEGVTPVAVFETAGLRRQRRRGGAAVVEELMLRGVPALRGVRLPRELARVPLFTYSETRRDERAPDFDLVFDGRIGDGTALELAPRLATCVLAIEGQVGLGGLRQAFDAYCRRQPYLSFALVAIPGADEPPRILREGAVRTRYSYAKSVDDLHSLAAHAVASVTRELILGERPIRAWPALEARPGPDAAGLDAIAAGYGRLAWRFGARIVRQALCFEKWNPGFCPVPVEEFLNLSTAPPANWLPEPKGLSYMADPFPMPGRPELILAEQFDEWRNRGIIVLVNRAGDGHPRIASAVDRSFHLSYPYIFKDRDEVYCVPEAAQSGRVSLFRAFPDIGRWEELGPLIDFPAVDPTIFHHGGLWWLFCTSLDRSETPPASTKLYVWFADRLTGPWRPHPLNPVKLDVRCSRPAGPPFVHDGRLFRPTQDCSESYGGAISLVEITALSETAFAERVITRVVPDPTGPYPSGFHTLVRADDISLIDGKRLVFSPSLPLIKLWRLLRSGIAGSPPSDPRPMNDPAPTGSHDGRAGSSLATRAPPGSPIAPSTATERPRAYADNDTAGAK